MGMDEPLQALRAHSRDWAADLRAIALEVDADPESIRKFLHLPALEYMATGWHSRASNAAPLIAGGHRYEMRSVLERVVFTEQLARGDAGAMLAAPGAPMAGPLVQILGDGPQQEWFFGRLGDRPTWVCFALTEPAHGSDASSLETSLVPAGDGFLLTGAKRYVGNAPRAELGVVFARSAPGPLGVRAVLVDMSAPGVCVTPLPTVGLRALVLGAIRITGVYITPDRLLGRHLPATRRGAWGWAQVFNQLRPLVAAIGLGIATAAHDYVRAQRPGLNDAGQARLAELGLRIEGVRQLSYAAATAVDADPSDGRLASAAKARAARLAEDVTLAAVDLMGPGARLTHPLLDKLARDARGVEFMEGAGNVQKLLVARP